MTTARDLTARLADLLRREHDAMADFIVALADFDQRRQWVELGHNSLFWFLHRELGLSKSASFYRKTAAELVQRFPEIIEPLRTGQLCLSSLAEVAKVVTPENRADVLPRFFHASKREAKEVLAELMPDVAPPQRDVVTTISAAAPVCDPTSESLSLAVLPSDLPPKGGSPANLVRANAPAESRDLLPQRRDDADTLEPLTAELRRLHVTVDREFLELLDATRDALSHANPGATTNELLKACMKLMLVDRAKKKGLVAKPRKVPPASTTDRIPANVKRAVAKRDGGKCQWPLASGGICGSTKRIEFAHRIARAHGGLPTTENIRQLCHFHNQYEARHQLGDAFMERFTRKRSRDAAPAQQQRSFDLGP
jgi:hypothetical protein